MTWWLSYGCGGPQQGGCDPCPPYCDSPLRPVPPRVPFVPGAAIPMASWQFSEPYAAEAPTVGACCGSCAEGHACEDTCPDQSKKAVGALYVSDAELDSLGTQVALMGADVDLAAAHERATKPGGQRGGGGGVADQAFLAQTGIKQVAIKATYDLCKEQGKTWDPTKFECDFTKADPDHLTTSASGPEFPSWPLTDYLDKTWTSFAEKWSSYRAQTFHEPTVFDQLRTEFSGLRDKWTGPLAQQTRANVPPPLSETSGGNAIPWGWIALGVGIIAIPFVLPSLAGAYLLITRGKSLGLLPKVA